MISAGVVFRVQWQLGMCNVLTWKFLIFPWNVLLWNFRNVIILHQNQRRKGFQNVNQENHVLSPSFRFNNTLTEEVTKFSKSINLKLIRSSLPQRSFSSKSDYVQALSSYGSVKTVFFFFWFLYHPVHTSPVARSGMVQFDKKCNAVNNVRTWPN